MSRLETALMQVTVGCRPFHANLTALHAGAQRLPNRARYREMESDAHHTGEITLLHPSPGIAASRTTYTAAGVETAMGISTRKDVLMAAICRGHSVLDPAKTGPEVHFFLPLKQRQVRHNGCQPYWRRRSASRMLARSHPDQRMSPAEALLNKAPVPKPVPNSASA